VSLNLKWGRSSCTTVITARLWNIFILYDIIQRQHAFVTLYSNVIIWMWLQFKFIYLKSSNVSGSWIFLKASRRIVSGGSPSHPLWRSHVARFHPPMHIQRLLKLPRLTVCGEENICDNTINNLSFTVEVQTKEANVKWVVVSRTGSLNPSRVTRVAVHASHMQTPFFKE